MVCFSLSPAAQAQGILDGASMHDPPPPKKKKKKPEGEKPQHESSAPTKEEPSTSSETRESDATNLRPSTTSPEPAQQGSDVVLLGEDGATPSTEKGEGSPQAKAEERKLPPELGLLSQSTYLFDYSAGGRNQVAEAYANVLNNGAAEADLDWILTHGSPAGRIYAACLIRKIDPARGTTTMRQMLVDNKTLVTHKTARGEDHYTLAEIITDLLSPSPTIQIIQNESQ